MPQYDVGREIRETRKAKHISGDVLCRGICTKGTLSKIESNTQNPNRKVLDALLQRLGLSSERYDVTMTPEEYERYRLEWQITNMQAKDLYPTEALRKQYKAIIPPMNDLEEQFYLFATALEQLYYYHDTSNSWDSLIKAMRRTVPDFTPDLESSSRYFSTIELMILNNIAVLEYYDRNEKARAFERMYFIRDYFKDNASEFEAGKQLPCILFNLSCWEEDRGHYEENIALAEEGITISLKENRLSHLGILLYCKAFGLARLGNRKEADAIFTQSFAVMDALEPSSASKLDGIKEANEVLGFAFTDK